MKEEWKRIDCANNYEISNLGRVRNFKRKNVLKPSTTKDGYSIVNLSINGVAKCFSVHRLIALAFIEKPYVLFQKFSPDDVIAWLEKQESVEEIVARCKDSWYNEGKIAGMAEGITDEEKYQQGWHDAIEKQGKEVRNERKNNEPKGNRFNATI